MGTRSNIAYKKPDGTFKFFYHHWDGYIKHLGNLLNKHLNEEFLVEKMFEINTSICSTLTVKEHLEKQTNSNKEERENYIKKLSETENYQIGGLFVKAFRNTNEHSGQCKNKKELLSNCNEEYIYLYENKKWKVKPYFSNSFTDLNFAVKANDVLEDILIIIRKEEKATKINERLDLNQQKLNKSHDFMETKRTLKQDVFIKDLLNNKDDKEFTELVTFLAQTKSITMLSEKINKDLPEKEKPKIKKMKI